MLAVWYAMLSGCDRLIFVWWAVVVYLEVYTLRERGFIVWHKKIMFYRPYFYDFLIHTMYKRGRCIVSQCYSSQVLNAGVLTKRQSSLGAHRRGRLPLSVLFGRCVKLSGRWRSGRIWHTSAGGRLRSLSGGPAKSFLPPQSTLCIAKSSSTRKMDLYLPIPEQGRAKGHLGCTVFQGVL